MKKYLMTLAAVLSCAMMSPMLTSCVSEDNSVPTPEPDQSQLADVTIMYYGHGGGNLDRCLIHNLRQMYSAEASSYKNVKIAVEYKFSRKEDLADFFIDLRKEELKEELAMWGEDADSELIDIHYLLWMAPEGNSTFRFVLDPEKTLKTQAEGHYLPGENADITNPDSLTNFINWAAKACPAKSYVLVLNDHGGGYMPYDDAYNENASARATRGVIYDKGNAGHHFSAPSLAHAIKAADIRPNVIYFDACLMNNIEYVFELKDVTDYYVASTYTEIAGCPYATMIECLSGAPDNLKYAFEKYIEYYVKHFDPVKEEDVFYYDMTLTETAGLDRLGKAMREFTDRLCDTYKNGTAEQKQKIDDVTKKAVKITDDVSLYDVGRYMEGMRKALPEVFDDAFWTELKSAFNSCVVGQYTSKYLLNHDYQVDYSVLLAVKGAYQNLWWDKNNETNNRVLTHIRNFNPDGSYTTYSVNNGEFKDGVTPDYTLTYYNEGQWGHTLESVYGALAFDKATGWSRWLLLNEQQPSFWCNNEFRTPLPDISEE